MMRIGHGYDVHGFCAGEFLMVGGVKIPYHQSFEAHSDGDVLLHAISDALLGALALGDIGKHFPDTAVAFKNMDSRILLRRVMDSISQHGYHIGNIDATVVAQAPKMRPYIDEMRHIVAKDLQTAVTNINIKATTTEKLGFVGREDGIASHAVCLLMRSD